MTTVLVVAGVVVALGLLSMAIYALVLLYRVVSRASEVGLSLRDLKPPRNGQRGPDAGADGP